MTTEWTYEALPIHGWRILDSNGNQIVRDIYDEEIAAQIVREHNAHAALVEAIESRASEIAIECGLGVSEWRSFLTAKETEALALAEQKVALASKGE